MEYFIFSTATTNYNFSKLSYVKMHKLVCTFLLWPGATVPHPIDAMVYSHAFLYTFA